MKVSVISIDRQETFLTNVTHESDAKTTCTLRDAFNMSLENFSYFLVIITLQTAWHMQTPDAGTTQHLLRR